MEKKSKFLLVSAFIAVLFSSCYTTKVTVGNLSPKQPMTKINSEWNHHILFGLVPLSNTKMRADDYVGNRPRYMIKTNQSFLNGLVSCLTFALYTPSTTTYYVPKDSYRESRDRSLYERPSTCIPVGNGEPPILMIETTSEERQEESKNKVSRPLPKRTLFLEPKTDVPTSDMTTVQKDTDPQSNSYRATVFFKSGAKMDGIVTHLSGDGTRLNMTLLNGMIIETNLNEIERIVKK